ncbi:MAG: hypothetical protein JWP44_447 [Mucilaginibacter sp.]|nr:hypothetical protein [Mucilaginibacter sp.]
MKKTLLIALLLIPFLGISQTTKPIEGFLGIKFGSSRLEVLTALNAKGGIIDKKESTPDMLVYKNIKLGHRDAGAFIVKFIENKAFEADFIFDPGLDAKTIDYYNDLVADLNSNYGKGDFKPIYKDPYSATDNDGDKIVGMKNAEVTYETYWLSDNKNTIAATINESLAVLLTYQDEALTGIALKKQKAKEKSDF